MNAASRFAEIDRLKSLLDSLRPLPEHTVRTLHEQQVLEWTYHSNAIEGNTLTLKETKVALEGIAIGGKTLREHFEVINHKEAIDYVEAIVQNQEALSEWQIKSIHHLMLKNIDDRNAGQYRQENVVIAGAEHLSPDYIKVPEVMAGLMDWYRRATGLDSPHPSPLPEGEGTSLMHPVECAARLHVDFVGIHPFVDDNGCSSRLLMNFELMRQGFLPVIIPVENRLAYYDALDTAHTRGDYSLSIELVASLEQATLERYLRIVQGATDTNR
jgi:Fic family protein